jgi:hypothetical protein
MNDPANGMKPTAFGVRRPGSRGSITGTPRGQERVIRRKPVVGFGLAFLALVGTACFGNRVTGNSVPNVANGAATHAVAASAIAGDVLLPGPPYPFYLFERATPPTGIQKSSTDLVGVVTPHQNLHVVALKSTQDTAALVVLEVSIHARWGRLMIPAERQIIQAFADNPSLGKWLILLTDVDVRGEPDPIPMTAYRWTRDEVEQYKKCGIPAAVIDTCTQSFYLLAKTVLVSSKIRGVQQ